MNQREQGRGANYQYGVKRRDFNRAAHTARLARVAPSAQLRRAALIIVPTNPIRALGRLSLPCRRGARIEPPAVSLRHSPRLPTGRGHLSRREKTTFCGICPVSITRNSLSPPKTGSFAPGTDGSNPSPRPSYYEALARLAADRRPAQGIIDPLVEKGDPEKCHRKWAEANRLEYQEQLHSETLEYLPPARTRLHRADRRSPPAQ